MFSVLFIVRNQSIRVSLIITFYSIGRGEIGIVAIFNCVPFIIFTPIVCHVLMWSHKWCNYNQNQCLAFEIAKILTAMAFTLPVLWWGSARGADFLFTIFALSTHRMQYRWKAIRKIMHNNLSEMKLKSLPEKLQCTLNIFKFIKMN